MPRSKAYLKPRLLELLESGEYSVGAACKELGMSRAGYDTWRRVDKEFAAEADKYVKLSPACRTGFQVNPLKNKPRVSNPGGNNQFGTSVEREALRAKNLVRQDNLLQQMEDAGANDVPAEIMRRYAFRLTKTTAPDEVPFNKEELQFIQKVHDTYAKQMPKQVDKDIKHTENPRNAEELAEAFARKLPMVLSRLEERSRTGSLPPVVDAKFRELIERIGPGHPTT